VLSAGIDALKKTAVYFWEQPFNMKRVFSIVASILALAAGAQTKEGRVVYERTTQMANIRFGSSGGNLPPEIQAQMDRMPKSRTDQYELLFTPQHSLYQFLPNATADEGNNTFAGGGMVINMRMGGSETTYVDYASGKRVDQREIFDKNYVVADTITKLQWKLSDETKTILNFTAKKATATNIVTRPRVTMENGEMKREMVTDTVPVVAWYTTEVPVATGPGFQGQLPGLMLELDVNRGQNVTTAIEFSPKVAAAKIKEPKDGKHMTAAEFNTERDKMMEEMRRNRGNGNVIRMN
jgi:GLPGLI family protein